MPAFTPGSSSLSARIPTTRSSSPPPSPATYPASSSTAPPDSRRSKVSTKHAVPHRPHSAHALLRCFTPRPSGGREGSSCEAAPDGPRETYSLCGEREAEGADEAAGPSRPPERQARPVLYT